MISTEATVPDSPTTPVVVPVELNYSQFSVAMAGRRRNPYAKDLPCNWMVLLGAAIIASLPTMLSLPIMRMLPSRLSWDVTTYQGAINYFLFAVLPVFLQNAVLLLVLWNYVRQYVVGNKPTFVSLFRFSGLHWGKYLVAAIVYTAAYVASLMGISFLISWVTKSYPPMILAFIPLISAFSKAVIYLSLPIFVYWLLGYTFVQALKNCVAVIFSGSRIYLWVTLIVVIVYGLLSAGYLEVPGLSAIILWLIMSHVATAIGLSMNPTLQTKIAQILPTGAERKAQEQSIDISQREERP